MFGEKIKTKKETGVELKATTLKEPNSDDNENDDEKKCGIRHPTTAVVNFPDLSKR